MATHSCTLAWKIPWVEGPGRLQSMRWQSQTRPSDFTFTFDFHALEQEMATHSSVLAWRIPGTEEPGGLPSIASQRVGHDWATFTHSSPYLSSLLFSSFLSPLSTFFPFPLCFLPPKKCLLFQVSLEWASQVALVVKNLPTNAGDLRDVD